MEIDAANVNFFLWEAKFRLKKLDEKKNISGGLSTKEKEAYGQFRPSNNEKVLNYGMRMFNGMYPLSFPVSSLSQ